MKKKITVNNITPGKKLKRTMDLLNIHICTIKIQTTVLLSLFEKNKPRVYISFKTSSDFLQQPTLTPTSKEVSKPQ